VRPSALLFDLDGTLVDSQRDIAEALNSALVAVGRERLALEAIVRMIGDGARVLVARALGSDAEIASLLERTVSLFHAAYAERPCVHTRLLSGAADAIAIDLPRAVVTNKPRHLAMLVLEGLGIKDAFGVVYAGGDGPLKPAPDGVVSTAERLGVAIEHAWLIGDGPQDVLAGRAAGCFTIAVPGLAERERVLAAGPHLMVESMVDVARLARALVGQ
jgi:phosphoglycolate phosphatase